MLGPFLYSATFLASSGLNVYPGTYSSGNDSSCTPYFCAWVTACSSLARFFFRGTRPASCLSLIDSPAGSPCLMPDCLRKRIFSFAAVDNCPSPLAHSWADNYRPSAAYAVSAMEQPRSYRQQQENYPNLPPDNLSTPHISPPFFVQFPPCSYRLLFLKGPYHAFALEAIFICFRNFYFLSLQM